MLARPGLWAALLASFGVDRQLHRRPGFSDRRFTALTGFGHHLQANPALGAPATAVVALSQPVQAPLLVLPQPCFRDRGAPRLPRWLGIGIGMAAGAVGSSNSRGPVPMGPTDLEPESGPGAPDPGRPGSQQLVASNPGWRSDPQTSPDFASA